SFTNVAQAVEQLTIKLSKLPGMSADAAKAFQGINLGLAIAQTGYSLGAQSGNSTVGALGGAAEGAAAGSAFGPLGAAAGGLIGAASGLFGASNAHKEAAAALKQAADQLKTNVASYVAGASGSGVASALAQNKAQADALQKQLTDLLHKGGISGSDYTVESVQVQQSQQEIDDRTKQPFFRGITEQLNALQGPAGAYQNTLIDLSLAYDQNKKDAAAAGASTAQLTQIDTLYRESVEKATAAEQERITEQSTSIKIATDLANAHTLAQQQAADREQQQEEQRQRMFTLIQNGADAATIAAEQQRDAAEQAALATKQFADSINAVNSSVSQANDIMGTTGTVTGITNLATGYDATNGSGFQIDLSPFQLSTKAGDEAAISYLQGLYTGLDPTSANYSVYAGEIQALVDQIRSLEQQNQANGGAEGSGSANLTAAASAVGKVVTGTVTGISDAQANGVLGYLDSINTTLVTYLPKIAGQGGVNPLSALSPFASQSFGNIGQFA